MLSTCMITVKYVVQTRVKLDFPFQNGVCFRLLAVLVTDRDVTFLCLHISFSHLHWLLILIFYSKKVNFLQTNLMQQFSKRTCMVASFCTGFPSYLQQFHTTAHCNALGTRRFVTSSQWGINKTQKKLK